MENKISEEQLQSVNFGEYIQDPYSSAKDNKMFFLERKWFPSYKSDPETAKKEYQQKEISKLEEFFFQKKYKMERMTYENILAGVIVPESEEELEKFLNIHRLWVESTVDEKYINQDLTPIILRYAEKNIQLQEG